MAKIVKKTPALTKQLNKMFKGKVGTGFGEKADATDGVGGYNPCADYTDCSDTASGRVNKVSNPLNKARALNRAGGYLNKIKK